MRLLLAAALVGHGLLAGAVGLGAQAAPPDDLRITSAIFGTRDGSADVTPIVTHLARPGLLEFYAAPFWLEVDPAVGQNKTLVVYFRYRGQSHVWATTEPGAVSHALLVQHADPAGRRPPSGRAGDTLLIENAYYGRGATYLLATARVRALIQPGGQPFVVDDTAVGLRPTGGQNILALTYSYQGRRHSLVAWRGERVGYDRLVRQAALVQPLPPPAWVKDARPDPARQPGDRGPGMGRAPRRELAISELLKALAELQAVPAGQQSAAMTRATALTQSALANARRNIGYPYPSPSSRSVEALGTSAAECAANATASLRRALGQLEAAGPGRGVVFLRRALSEITTALAELSALAP